MEEDTIAGYNDNDIYYNKVDYCKTTEELSDKEKDVCNINKEKYDRMIEIYNAYSATLQRYEDIRVYTNREIQFMVNLVVGIGILGYYIYKNELYKNIS